MIPARILVATLLPKTRAPIYIVGNLQGDDRRCFEGHERLIYIDENDIDLSGRMPHEPTQRKHREWGWYKQMFIRLSIDRFIDAEQVVILDSEVFVFDNWDERRFYTEDGHPKCFYWTPDKRKPAWDYAMYQGAAFLYQALPGMSDAMSYANSDSYRRHISGVVLFSTKNIAYIWSRLEQTGTLQVNMRRLFHQMHMLAFSDHDFYGIAMDYGLCDRVVKTVPTLELLGWYDNHDDPVFERFSEEDPMWSMCQRYYNFPTVRRYLGFVDHIALRLGKTYQLDASLDAGNTSITQIIATIGTPNQPIYGHPEIKAVDDTLWNKRLAALTDLYRQLTAMLQRPARIFEIGCGNGYISMNLAAMGAIVTASEQSPEHIRTIDALTSEHPEYKIDLLIAAPDIAIQTDTLLHADMIISFDSLDSIIERHGEQPVKQFLSVVGEKVQVMVFGRRRIAQYAEFSPPTDERKFFERFSYLHELDAPRDRADATGNALYFISNAYCYVKGMLQPYDVWSPAPHVQMRRAYIDTRRYYVSSKYLMKKFWCEQKPGLLNRSQITNEAKMIQELDTILPNLPKILCTGENYREAWLIREYLPGLTIGELKLQGVEYDSVQLISDILELLTKLEASGYYHNDLRPWNVVVHEGKASLIDYAAITPYPIDCYDERDAYYAFLIFVWCVLTKHDGFYFPQRAPVLGVEDFPQEYRAWVEAILVPLHQGGGVIASFRSIREAFSTLGPMVRRTAARDASENNVPTLDLAAT